jgi:hypothetical protein
MRPVLNNQDTDCLVLAATAQLKAIPNLDPAVSETASKVVARRKAMIVGITDPELLIKLGEFNAAVFVAPQTGNANLSESDSAYRGLRTKNAAELSFAHDASLFHQYGKWSDKPANQQKSMLVLSKATSGTSSIESDDIVLTRVLRRIKNMHPEERMVLGDKLLRDNLRELTHAYFVPIKASKTERALLRREQEQEGINNEMLELNQLRTAEQEAKDLDAQGMVEFTIQEIKSFARLIPSWLCNNVPLLILWLSIFLVSLSLYLLGIPFVVLVLTGAVLKFPDRVPLSVELFMRSIIPGRILYPSM